jgi:hypothetical protein
VGYVFSFLLDGVCTMETRRVNGMSALLTSVACAVGRQVR